MWLQSKRWRVMLSSIKCQYQCVQCAASGDFVLTAGVDWSAVVVGCQEFRVRRLSEFSPPWCQGDSEPRLRCCLRLRPRCEPPTHASALTPTEPSDRRPYRRLLHNSLGRNSFGEVWHRLLCFCSPVGCSRFSPCEWRAFRLTNSYFGTWYLVQGKPGL